MRRAIQLAAVVCLALGLAGCGGSSDGEASTAVTASPANEASAQSGPGSSSAAGQAPQQVCDFTSTWQALDAQLTDAEKNLDDTALWGDTASAFDSSTAPEAVKDAWGPLVDDVDAIAQAVGSGNAQGAIAGRLAEEQRLHQSFTALFGQMCS